MHRREPINIIKSGPIFLRKSIKTKCHPKYNNIISLYFNGTDRSEENLYLRMKLFKLLKEYKIS